MKAFSSLFVMFLNCFFINIDIILQIYLIEFGSNKILFIKSSINCSIKGIISKKSLKYTGKRYGDNLFLSNLSRKTVFE